MGEGSMRSSLWPVLLGMAGLLAGAIALEAAGRSRESLADVVIISSSAQGEDDDGAEDAPLLGEPLDSSHAQARRLVRRSQFEEARPLFETLLETHGHTPSLLAEWGYFQLISGHAEEAEVSLREARQRTPDNPWLALSLATACRRSGKDGEAEALYHDALELRPHYAAAKLSLARFLRQRKRAKEALPLLQDIAESGSNEDRAASLTELGRSYMLLGKLPEADAAFDKAIGRAPASVSIRTSMAQAYLEHGGEEALGKAASTLQQAIQLAPAIPKLHALLGEALVEQGDSQGGRAAYERSLEIDPGYQFSRRRLLRLDLDAGAFAQAREHAAQLIAHAPKDPESFFLVGLVESRDRKLDAAREAYRKAIELADGTYPEAYVNLGKLEKSARNYDESIAHYQRALEQRSNYRTARNNLGLTLLAAGRVAEALVLLNELVAKHPSYPEAWLNLARVHSEKEEYDDAIRCLRKALELRPGYESARLNLASALRKSGKAQEAATVYDEILRSQPRYVSAWYNRGIALDKAGDVAGARSSYERAVSLDPDHKLSLKRLARLELRAQRFERAAELYTDILDRDASDVKSRRLRAEARAFGGDLEGCTRDTALAKKQDPQNANLERLWRLCNGEKE